MLLPFYDLLAYGAAYLAAGFIAGLILFWSRSPLGFVIAVIAGITAAYFWQRWLDRRRAAQQTAVCARCQYLLEGLPADGVCPECGTRFGCQGEAEILAIEPRSDRPGASDPGRERP